MHVHICTPCRELHRIEAVEVAIVVSCNKHWFLVLTITLMVIAIVLVTYHENSFWLQLINSLGYPKQHCCTSFRVSKQYIIC